MSTARTSLSHPLRIDALPIRRGLLGLTFCPGKKQPDSATGGWRRQLDLDIAALQRWQAAALVSVIEPDELIALEVPGLGAAARAAGIDWLLLPIVDGGVPGVAIENDCQEAYVRSLDAPPMPASDGTR